MIEQHLVKLVVKRLAGCVINAKFCTNGRNIVDDVADAVAFEVVFQKVNGTNQLGFGEMRLKTSPCNLSSEIVVVNSHAEFVQKTG